MSESYLGRKPDFDYDVLEIEVYVGKVKAIVYCVSTMPKQFAIDRSFTKDWGERTPKYTIKDPRILPEVPDSEFYETKELAIQALHDLHGIKEEQP